MQTNKTKNSKSRRVVAGVAIAAAAFTGVGAIPIVAPDVVAQAQAAEFGIWKYEVVDDHAELWGLTDKGKQKVQDNGGKLPDFPLEIEGKKVTSIGTRAFYNNQITSLPDTWGEITNIGGSAFSGNRITSLPDTWGKITNIGDYMFSGNQITSLPDTWGKITNIGDRAFYNNKITSLPDDWGEITSIGGSAFFGNQITSLPDTWGEITSIGNYVFYNNQITSLPDDWGEITSIGGSAFSENQITSLPDWSTLKTLQDSKENPEISSAARCTKKPLNVALVFDTSASIGQDGIDKYKQSTSDFVDNVSDKGISLASFDFSDDANAPQHLSKPEPLLVTKDSKEKVKASINEHFEIKGTTNWESGLINARDNNTVTDGKPRYDLVVFISDGFPNLKVTKENISYMQAAQKVANQLKEQGSKVISMGVGMGTGVSEGIPALSKLLPLSGTRENNDYYLGDWDELASMLVHTTQNVTCGTQVDARAQIIDKNGKTTDSAAQGFEFSAEVTQTKYNNVTTVGELKKTTPNALWSFPFEFNDQTGDDLRQSTADITITQKPKDGFTFLNGEYKIVNNEDGKVITTGSLTGDSTVIKDVPADAHVQVIAKYHDSSITPNVEESEKHNPGYRPAETTPGTAVDIEQVGDTELPDGTKFGTPDKTPEGWDVKVDEKTGKVTVTPPKDAKPGDKGEFTVPVTYPDGSKDNADVVVTVKDEGDDTGDSDKNDGSGDGDNTEGNDGDKTPGDNTGDSDKDNGSGDGDKDNTGGNDGDNTGGNNTPGDNTGDGDKDNGSGDGDNTGGNDGDNTGGNNTPGDNTKRPDFSGLPNDDNGKGTENGDGRDGGDKSDNSDKPSGAKVVDNGNKSDGTGAGGTGNGGVKGGFKPVAPANPSRVNQAPTSPSGFAPTTGPGVGAVLAGGSGSGAGKGAVVDTGGQVQESFWTKIANIFR